MKRWASLVWVGATVTVAVVTYSMKDSAGRAADHVMQLRADIAREKEQLTVLRAEWGVLDQPARLQTLVERYSTYLDLKPLDVRQLASIDDVPDKLPTPPQASLDGMRTGAITPVVKVPAAPKAPAVHKKPVPARSPVSAPAPVRTPPPASPPPIPKTGELE